MFKPFQSDVKTLLNFNKGKSKEFFNKKDESPTRNNGLEENDLETFEASQCEPSKTCIKVLEELEICLTK